MQFMEADVTEPAGMFGLNAVMLPEDMRNAGMAQVCIVASPGPTTVAGFEGPNKSPACPHAFVLPPLSKPRFHAPPTCMQGGKERLLKYLPLVEARMQDGRKYIAGDEFTAAGVSARQDFVTPHIQGTRLLMKVVCPLVLQHSLLATSSWQPGLRWP